MMHPFEKIIDYSKSSEIFALDELEGNIIQQLQTSAATPLVVTLQALNFRRAAFSVGMFSMLEAYLQDSVSEYYAFKSVKNILIENGKVELATKLNQFILAINVLKHGRGRSYDELVAMTATLPFVIKKPDQHFFYEGDVSEIDTLIQVDNEFVNRCAEVIYDIITELRRLHDSKV